MFIYCELLYAPFLPFLITFNSKGVARGVLGCPWSPFVSLVLSKQPTIFRGENAMTISFDPVWPPPPPPFEKFWLSPWIHWNLWYVFISNNIINRHYYQIIILLLLLLLLFIFFNTNLSCCERTTRHTTSRTTRKRPISAFFCKYKWQIFDHHVNLTHRNFLAAFSC